MAGEICEIRVELPKRFSTDCGGKWVLDVGTGSHRRIFSEHSEQFGGHTYD